MRISSQALGLRQNLVLYSKASNPNILIKYYFDFFFDLKRMIQQDYNNFGSCAYIDSLLQNNGIRSAAGDFTYIELGVLFTLTQSLQASHSYDAFLKQSDRFPICPKKRHFELADYSVTFESEPKSFYWIRWQNGGQIVDSSYIDLTLNYVRNIKNQLTPKRFPIAEKANSGAIPIEGPASTPACSAESVTPQTDAVEKAAADAAALLQKARRGAEQIRQQAQQEANQLHAAALEDADHIRLQAQNETTDERARLSAELIAAKEERAALQEKLDTIQQEASQRTEELVRTQLKERRAALCSQWAAEDALAAQEAHEASAEMDRAKQELCTQVDQLKISWRKDMEETIQRMEDSQQQLEASLRLAKNSLYHHELTPLADCYSQLNSILQGRAVSSLQTQLMDGSPDPAVLQQAVDSLLKSLTTYQRKLGKAINRLGLYESVPAVGAPYDDVTQSTVDGEEPDNPDQAVVEQCICPGVYFQPEGDPDKGTVLTRSIVRLKATEE